MKNTKEERYSIELRSLKMSLDINLYIIHDPVEEDCPHCGQKYLNIFDNKECVYEGNITHNLNRMAEACGIYMELWRPEEIGVIKAEQLINPLTDGLKKLKENPEYYRTFDSPDGWGRYFYFLPFVENYLNACIEYPEAIIEVSR